MNTPEVRKKGPGSVGRGGNTDDPNEDAKSNASSSSSTKAPIRRTPAQVKAADARKTKVTSIKAIYTWSRRISSE